MGITDDPICRGCVEEEESGKISLTLLSAQLSVLEYLKLKMVRPEMN